MFWLGFSVGFLSVPVLILAIVAAFKTYNRFFPPRRFDHNTITAKVKSERDLPEHAKCCPARLAKVRAWGKMTLDLSTAQKTGDPQAALMCGNCHTVMPSLTLVLPVGSNEDVVLEYFNLPG